jgi:hypothetical protein
MHCRCPERDILIAVYMRGVRKLGCYTWCDTEKHISKGSIIYGRECEAVQLNKASVTFGCDFPEVLHIG